MLDLTQVQSFLAVQDTGSFSLAARRLGLGQSTVSQHVARLEERLGRRLFARDTHGVALTAEGEALLPQARAMLALAEQVTAQFSTARLRGRLRLGLSEDLVAGQLPFILEAFTRSHPGVDMELTVALSAPLFAQLDLGEIDMVLAKRRIGESRGALVYREALVWLARDPAIARQRPLPLIAFPPPSVTRTLALSALEGAGIPWRIACTSGSLSGLTAAARAGMGVFVQPRGMAPPGLKEIGAEMLPALEQVEFVLIRRRGADPALLAALEHEILRNLAPGALREG